MGANSKSQTAGTIISPQEILHSSRQNMWEGIECGNISQYNRKTIHLRCMANMFVSGFPRSYWIWSCLSPSEKESPKHIVKGVCSLLVCGSWERVLPLAANMIFHNMFVDIPWSALKYREFVFDCACRTGYTEPEKKIMFLDRGTRVGSADCSTAPVFINCFLLFLGARPFLTISWEERSSGCWGNECFGYLMTQKQWEKCKQSLDRSLDPNFHTWSLWLLWRDKL